MLIKSVCIYCAAVEPYSNGHEHKGDAYKNGKPDPNPPRRTYSPMSGPFLGRTNPPSGWNEQDEINWSKGFVHCPMILNHEMVRINEPPPHFCPYAAEHAVLQETT